MTIFKRVEEEDSGDDEDEIEVIDDYGATRVTSKTIEDTQKNNTP